MLRSVRKMQLLAAPELNRRNANRKVEDLNTATYVCLHDGEKQGGVTSQGLFHTTG